MSKGDWPMAKVSTWRKRQEPRDYLAMITLLALFIGFMWMTLDRVPTIDDAVVRQMTERPGD